MPRYHTRELYARPSRVGQGRISTYRPLSDGGPNHLAISLSYVPSFFIARRCWLISAIRSLSSCRVLIPTIRLSHTFVTRIEGIVRIAYRIDSSPYFSGDRFRDAPPVMLIHQTRRSFRLREPDHPTRVRALPAV